MLATRMEKWKTAGAVSKILPVVSVRMVLMTATLLLAVAAAIPPMARADSGNEIVWTAAKVNGTVSYRESGGDGVRWIPLRQGALLSALAQLKTGPDGRAELTFENSTIVAAPNSELNLPGPTPRNAVYRVSQGVGTFLYKIKHATRDKFEVQTPYLTTIIKGTVFTVLAGPTGSSVHVTEGAVFVRPSIGDSGSFVRPGETARVTDTGRDRVTIQGARALPGNGGKPAGDDAKGQSSSSNGAGRPVAQNEPGPRPVKIVFRDAPRGGNSASLAGSGNDGGPRQALRSENSGQQKNDGAINNVKSSGAGANAGNTGGNSGLAAGNSGGGSSGLGASGSSGGGSSSGLGGGSISGLGGGSSSGQSLGGSSLIGGEGGGNSAGNGGGNAASNGKGNGKNG